MPTSCSQNAMCGSLKNPSSRQCSAGQAQNCREVEDTEKLSTTEERRTRRVFQKGFPLVLFSSVVAMFSPSSSPSFFNDNADVPKADRDIDALYQALPGEFTASRNALAKTLTGEPAREVRSLKKPTVVPWAINQVYWKARPVYDTLMARGRELRTAQIASLKGKKSDVRPAMEAHRRAVGEAVHRAQQIATEAGLSPDAEQLARMLEAVSLAPAPPADAGRFTEVI